jgi:hypothetical protein
MSVFKIRGRKVVGSIPAQGTKFFNWPNPSSRTMALESTQPMTEMSTRNLPDGKGRPARKANLTANGEPIVYKMRGPRYLTTLRASLACYRDRFTLLLNGNNLTPRYKAIHQKRIFSWSKIPWLYGR